jgi:RNA polymerase sigma factor (sigma-70 family)
VSADASDAIDGRLLAEGRHQDLVARHFDALRDRARLRLGPGDGDDVVQDAVLRLLRELRRGKSYPVPFRVVAHNVLTWTIREWLAGRVADPGPLPDGWDVPADEAGFAELESRDAIERAIEPLPSRDREVVRLRYVEGEEIAGIAERLRMTRNAVDQALYRGRRALKESWLDG